MPKPVKFLDFEDVKDESLVKLGIEGKGQWLGKDRSLVVEMPAGIPEQGTITFWFQPSWAGNDHDQYYLLESSRSDRPNSLALRKLIDSKGLSYLQLIILNSDGEPKYCDSYQIETWKPGTWYHIAAAWCTNKGAEKDGLLMLVNGEPWAGLKHTGISWSPANEIHIGYTVCTDIWEARGIIDNLAFYDQELTIEEMAASYKSNNINSSGTVSLPVKPKPIEPTQISTSRLKIIPVLPQVYVPSVKIGNISEMDWKQAAEVSNFSHIYTTEEENTLTKTAAWLAFDEKNLYIRVKCRDANPEKLAASGKRRDDPIWNGDVVEIFLQSPDEKEPITHLVVNSGNVQWDSRIDRTQSLETTSWNGNWQSRSSIGTDFWEVILSIPWNDITKASPLPSKGWRLNIGRNSPRFGPSAWACTMGIFNRPQWFGKMELGGRPSSPVKMDLLKAEKTGADEIVTTMKLSNSADVALQGSLIGKSSKTIKEISEKVSLAAGQEENFKLKIPVMSGEQIVSVTILSSDGEKTEKNFFVDSLQSFNIYLDKFAYWTGEVNPSLNINSLPEKIKLPATLDVYAEKKGSSEKIPLLKKVTLETGTGTFPLNISGFLPARYALRVIVSDSVSSEFAQTEFLIVPKPPFREVVPIQKTEIRKKDGIILVNGKPTLPVFMHWLGPDGGENEKARSLGITSVAAFVPGEDPSVLKNQLDTAYQNGFNCQVNLDHSYFLEELKNGQVKYRLDRVEKVVKEYRNHPALFGWFLFDEPNNYTSTGDFICEPKEVEKAYNLVKILDPNHIVILICSSGRDFGAYKNTVDVMATDVYPIPDCPVEQISQSIERARAETKKPVWSVVQCSWMRPGQRPVLPQELLNQAHLSLIHNAAGLGFFNWDGTSEETYASWREKGYFRYLRSTFKVLDLQLRELTPALFEGQPEDIVIGSASPNAIQARGIRYGNNLYIIASNITQEVKTVSFKWGGKGNFAWAEVLGEGWELPVQNRIVADTFGAMESRIYRLK